jgi:hypothetical protein
MGKQKKEPDTQPSEAVFRPDAIYFDTNTLLAEGWPSPSTQLLQVMDRADHLGLPLCIPEAVNQELEGHWLRDLAKDWHEANGRIERCNKKAHTLVTFDKLPKLPTEDELRKAVRLRIKSFTERFRIAPLTGRPLSEFLGLAINRGATFEDEGKGFQDGVILCSILDNMKTSGFTAGVLVTHDGIFKSSGALELMNGGGVTLKIVVDLDELEKMLRRYFNSIVLENMDRERKQLISALETQKDVIQTYLTENLLITANELGLWTRIRKVEALHLLSIENAHKAFDLYPDQYPNDPSRVKISADVKVQLILDIEQYATPPQEKLKVGGRSVPSPEPVSPFVTFALEHLAKLREAVAVIEAEATKIEDAYSDIHFTATYLKQQGGLAGFGRFPAI